MLMMWSMEAVLVALPLKSQDHFILPLTATLSLIKLSKKLETMGFRVVMKASSNNAEWHAQWPYA